MNAGTTTALATVLATTPLAQGTTQGQAQTQAEVRARVRDAVEQARAAQREVQQALQEQAAQREGQVVRTEQVTSVQVPPAPTRVRVQPDGRVEVDGPDAPVVVEGQPGILVPRGERREAIPQEVMDIIGWTFTMIVIVALGVPLVRAFGRWLDRRGGPAPAVPHELVSRLDRIEAAVETVAVEVERISEGQRFTSRLMAEMRQAPQLGEARVAEPRA